jgi:hypothetical protein
VLHLDKLPLYGNGWKPKVIVRTMVAHDEPMDPGVQHLGDLVDGISEMLETVNVRRLTTKVGLVGEYENVLGEEESSLVIEYAEMYND